MIAFVLKSADDKQMGGLLFQKSKDFKVYLPQEDHLTPDYEGKIPIAHGRFQDVTEPLVCLLEPGVVPDRDFVRRVLRTARRHPDFNVYHVNLPEGKPWPRKLSVQKLFVKNVQEGLTAPLSSFVFRTEALMEKAVFQADSSLDTLATVLAAAKDKPIRNVWRQTLEWTAPALATDPASVEKRIRERLDFYHWSESFFGENDYPLGTGDRLSMIAAQLAQLFPTYTVEDLKEQMYAFQAAQGPVRKLRAASALKSALKERQQKLTL